MRFAPLFRISPALALLLSPVLASAESPPSKPPAATAKPEAPKVEKEDKPKAEKPAEARPAAEKPKAPAAPATPATPATPTHSVKGEDFVQKAKVSGTVESTRETPVELNLKRWGDLTVIRAVPHGTEVKAGDLLIELETKDLKKKIEETKLAMPGKEIELSAAELELESAEKSTPISLAKSLREKMQAEQDLAHFEDESRPMRERGAKEDVKEIGEALAYAEEELNQLKKMYEQDDLTEETEEIILRRTGNTVARYRWMLEQAEARTERTLNTLIPREHESLKTNLELQQINWRAGEKSLREGLEKKRLDTAAKRREMDEAKKALAEMEEDLAAMRVTAAHDGIVYYGMSQRGKWTTASLVDRKLIPGGKLSMREIVMTVVDPAKVQVRLALTEDQLKDLAGGQDGTLSLKWKPDVKFDARVKSILYVPYADKTFDAVLSVKTPADAPALYPGMTADAEITVYEKKDAIVIPKAALKKEGEKEAVTGADGKAIPVKTGRSQGDKVEILEGLKAGDTIRLPEAKPEAKPAAGPETKPEAKPEAKPETNPEAKPEAKPAPATEA